MASQFNTYVIQVLPAYWRASGWLAVDSIVVDCQTDRAATRITELIKDKQDVIGVRLGVRRSELLPPFR
jgi:hypothetical protein